MLIKILVNALIVSFFLAGISYEEFSNPKYASHYRIASETAR